jgi:hypothetical protein
MGRFQEMGTFYVGAFHLSIINVREVIIVFVKYGIHCAKANLPEETCSEKPYRGGYGVTGVSEQTRQSLAALMLRTWL